MHMNKNIKFYVGKLAELNSYKCVTRIHKHSQKLK